MRKWWAQKETNGIMTQRKKAHHNQVRGQPYPLIKNNIELDVRSGLAISFVVNMRF